MTVSSYFWRLNGSERGLAGARIFPGSAGITVGYSLGGYGRAAMVLATIYLVGIVLRAFPPETRGKSLPA